MYNILTNKPTKKNAGIWVIISFAFYRIPLNYEIFFQKLLNFTFLSAIMRAEKISGGTEYVLSQI